MNYLKGEKFLIGFDYDFARDGGAIGAISLTQFAGNAIDATFRILKAYVLVTDPITSGGTPTMTFGNTTDPDGYFVDVYALLTGANLGAQSGQVAGDLIWDDTQKASVIYAPAVADDFNVLLTVGTADLTAGKMNVFLECLTV